MCHQLEGDADAGWNGLLSYAKESVIILSNLINVTFKLHLGTKKAINWDCSANLCTGSDCRESWKLWGPHVSVHTKPHRAPSEICCQKYQHANFTRSSTIALKQPLSGNYSLCWQFSYWSHMKKIRRAGIIVSFNPIVIPKIVHTWSGLVSFPQISVCINLHPLHVNGPSYIWIWEPCGNKTQLKTRSKQRKRTKKSRIPDYRLKAISLNWIDSM